MGESGFEDFVEQGYGRLLGYAVMLAGRRDEAEEVVQEALFRCLRRWRRLPVEHRMAYARRAVFHEFLRGRRRSRREPVVADLIGSVELAVDVADGVVERDRLMAALLALAPRQRAAVVARFVLDLSEAQAARELGCSVGTVKSLTSRGLARLREVLPDAGSGTEAVFSERRRR